MEGRDLMNQLFTGYPPHSTHELPVPRQDGSGYPRLQLQCFERCTFFPICRLVIFIDDVQDNAVVGFVPVVSMPLPVGRADVDFYIAAPLDTVDNHTRRLEIGTGIVVLGSPMDDPNRFTRSAMQGLGSE